MKEKSYFVKSKKPELSKLKTIENELGSIGNRIVCQLFTHANFYFSNDLFSTHE